VSGTSSARRALVSVSDKTGLVPFVTGLAKLGFEILSTGGTAQALRGAGLTVKDVSEETGFPEIMDGRVKTLHPKVHGALLGRRDAPDHVDAAQRHGIRFIDLVVVNLYPFEATVRKPGVTLEEAIENIDIGGPSMIRSASKNHHDVGVVVEPGDYAAVLAELERGGGALSVATRAALARKAFETTAAYDAAIAAYLGEGAADGGFPARFTISGAKVMDLRYGENPHQKAAFYRTGRVAPGACVAWAETLSGKELSYNNLLDLEAALELAKDLGKLGPAAAIVKHTNPCGAAVAETLAEAFDRAYAGDPVSAFGGILALSRPMDAATAERVVSKNRFFEAVVAPDYAPEALRALVERSGWGKDLRVLRAAAPAGGDAPADLDVARLRGGLLVQERDAVAREEVERAPVATRRAPTDAELRDLAIAWIVSRHVKSNAIVIAKDERVAGVGAGQMSRVDAVKAAIEKAGEGARGAALASDAFFPFRDGVDAAARAGVSAIAQPGGSKRDAEVVAAADEAGMAMVLTGRRHFRHGS